MLKPFLPTGEERGGGIRGSHWGKNVKKGTRKQEGKKYKRKGMSGKMREKTKNRANVKSKSTVFFFHSDTSLQKRQK